LELHQPLLLLRRSCTFSVCTRGRLRPSFQLSIKPLATNHWKDGRQLGVGVDAESRLLVLMALVSKVGLPLPNLRLVSEMPREIVIQL